MSAVIEQGFFKGAVVVIDDEVATEKDRRIVEIVESIRAAGGHAILMSGLPPENFDAENYRNIAFVVMDWRLGHPTEVDLSDDLRNELYEANVTFIRKLGEHRHTPVVIFTNEKLDEVREFLEKHDDMARHLKTGRLLLRRKEDVGAKVYQVLNDWAKEVPSVITLKTWERESLRALNDLFIDFHDRSKHWPVMLWETYKADGPSPAEDLGRLITRLVASRMNLINLDLEPYVGQVEVEHEADAVGYAQTLKSVLEGERTLDASRLHKDSIAPGDFFRWDEAMEVFINVRPDCDVIVRSDASVPDLYLLRGERIPDKKVETGTYGQVLDREPHFTVFSMFEGNSYRFELKNLTVKSWTDCKDRRVGRLLPPFSTQLQQKHAAYLQRVGLPTVPRVLRNLTKYPKPKENQTQAAPTATEAPAAAAAPPNEGSSE